MIKESNRQAVTFLFVGLVTVLIDFLAYLLMSQLIASSSISKSIGFVVGTVFAYVANKKLTFKHEGDVVASAAKFSGVYGLTLFLNVTTNEALLALLSGVSYKLHLAFLGATGVSALTNFIGMKFFAFAEGEKRVG